MQRHHTGSGRRRVIPEDWSAHHRPVANATHGAIVQIRRPGATKGEFNKTTGKWDGVPHQPYFTGSARIQIMGRTDSAEQLAAEQQVSTAGYAVLLDHSLQGVQLDDLITITTMPDNGDVRLIGRNLTVTSIESGSLHWERRLVCTDDLETQEA